MKKKNHRFAANKNPVGRWELRFAILGGGIAWTLHLLLAYVVAEFGCIAGLGQVSFLGLNVVSWLLFLVTIPTLGMGLAATYVSWRCHSKAEKALAAQADLAGENFVAYTGLISNLIFVFIIVVQTIPIFYFLREC